ncbi:SRPBCC domain-containing protein [Mucilaginibacter sp. L3T2-6]|uniref:SRPBCC domain-containing protein n=1 Tax=Mucilaginibacter sp. L3T2-6 TaxID=3062491 RepID=UPI0026760484|nr:SRPBCC domain-containing protein [Mucilaginibacter sp. L3T2-6]MDO3640988.1 SRPBCC domain-containing protein [Mucilaginibacter sp. L3T2-6]MDV6213536.1 SRPBCC domain-containing protein [Mucilaginibacter sp. L3T2-6]
MKGHVVKKEIAINAQPSAVWDALTDPEKTKKYFFNCKVVSSWKEGTPITFKGKMFWFIPVEMKGRILKIEPEKVLQYNLKNTHDGSATVSTVTDMLTYKDGVTTLSITDDVGDGPGAEKRFEKSEKGWDKVLHGLKDLVEHTKGADV